MHRPFFERAWALVRRKPMPVVLMRRPLLVATLPDGLTQQQHERMTAMLKAAVPASHELFVVPHGVTVRRVQSPFDLEG